MVELIKKPISLIILGATFYLGYHYYQLKINPLFSKGLVVETLEAPSAVPVQEEVVQSSFGYFIGAWPTTFLGEPILTSVPYAKGPPTHFIKKMVQVWVPGQIELSIEGPKTPVPGMSLINWKTCMMSRYRCSFEKRKLFEQSFSVGLLKPKSKREVYWFETSAPEGVAGLHVVIHEPLQRVDRFCLVNEEGITQNLTLYSTLDGAGERARALFLQILVGLKSKRTLDEPRQNLKHQISKINLKQVMSMSDAKSKTMTLTQVQLALVSGLALDPSTIAPFFHLAGVSHLFAIEGLKRRTLSYKHEESWALIEEQNLRSVLQYLKDFDASKERDAALANAEALLQDLLSARAKVQQKR